MRMPSIQNSSQMLTRMAACSVDIEPEEDQSDYYDILLLGLTGQDKSTTANKLLQMDITFSEPNPYTQ